MYIFLYVKLDASLGLQFTIVEQNQTKVLSAQDNWNAVLNKAWTYV